MRMRALSDAIVLLASRCHAGHKHTKWLELPRKQPGIQHAKTMRRIVWCHKWPVWLYRIFPHYLIKETILGMLLKIKCVFFILSTNLPETFHFV